MKKIFVLSIISFFLCSCGFAKDDKMIEAKEIIKQLNKGNNIQLVDKIITDDLDFTKIEGSSIDPNGSLVHTVKPEILFIKCVFLGKIICSSSEGRVFHQAVFANNVSFRTCDFRNTVDFSRVVVNGNLNFAQSAFRENADLNGIQVRGGNMQMWELKAEKEFAMADSRSESLNLMDAHFSQACILQSTQCSKLQLSNVVCDSTLDLSMSNIKGAAYINYGKFSGSVLMNESRVESSFDMMSCKFNKDLQLENSLLMGRTRFNETHFGDVLTNNTYFLVEPSKENVVVKHPIKINVLESKQIEIK